MSKTSVRVIPLLQSLCWLPLTYTRKQSNSLPWCTCLSSSSLPSLPILSVPRLAEPRLLFLRAFTYPLSFACSACIRLVCRGHFYSGLEAEHPRRLLSELPSPVELISPLSGSPQHPVAPILALTSSYVRGLSCPQAHEFLKDRAAILPVPVF